MSVNNTNKKDSWTREQWLEFTKEYSLILEYKDGTIPSHIRTDHEINREYLIGLHKEDTPRMIEKYFPQELLDDKKFMAESLLVDMELIQHASDRLLNDPQFALELVKLVEEKHDPKDYSRQLDFSFLGKMDSGVINNKDVWRTVIQTTNPDLTIKDEIIGYISSELRADKEFLIEIATMKHEADLHFAKNPPDKYGFDDYSYQNLNHKLGQGSWCPYDMVNEELLSNKEFALQLVSADPVAYVSLDRKLQEDKDIALATYQADNEAIAMFRGSILEDKNFALIALSKAPDSIYKRLNEELRADRDIMVAALSKEKFRFVGLNIDPTFLVDREIMTMAIKSAKDNGQFLPFNLKNDPEFVLETKCFDYMSDRLKQEVGNQDPEQCLQSMIRKNKLENTLPEKPTTKAQQLSNDIESEDFSYKPQTTKTNRTKL